MVNMRWIAIILSVATMVMTVVTLTVISDGATGLSLLNVGMEDSAVLAFLAVSLVIGIFGLLVPIFSVVSGVCIIATAFLASEAAVRISSEGMIIFVCLAVVVMFLGVIASLVMTRYIRANVRGINMFQCSIMTWKGVQVPPEWMQYLYQNQYRY